MFYFIILLSLFLNISYSKESKNFSCEKIKNEYIDFEINLMKISLDYQNCLESSFLDNLLKNEFSKIQKCINKSLMNIDNNNFILSNKEKRKYKRKCSKVYGSIKDYELLLNFSKGLLLQDKEKLENYKNNFKE